MDCSNQLEASRDAFLDWRADENIAEMSAHMTEKGCEVEVGILRVLAARHGRKLLNYSYSTFAAGL